jgi:cytochrome c-type biogenesis protein CcmH/NrfG
MPQLWYNSHRSFRYEQALRIRKELDDRAGQADILVQLGHVYRLRGKTGQAQKYYYQAKELSAET